MVRSCGRQQLIDWHLKVYKTVFEAEECVKNFAWPPMTDEEKEDYLKKKQYRTQREEKEFIRIWKNKYWIQWHSSRFYEACKHHRISKK